MSLFQRDRNNGLLISVEVFENRMTAELDELDEEIAAETRTHWQPILTTGTDEEKLLAQAKIDRNDGHRAAIVKAKSIIQQIR